MIFKKVIEYFEKTMPDPQPELHYTNPFELLVAVILSAQCADKRVNQITPALFEAYPTAEKMSKATVNDIFQLIRSCSYPNSKSRHLLSMSKILHEKYHGQIPSDIDEMQKLPGVGRKTANVVAAVAFGKQTMPVDTHVFRVSARLGLTHNSKTPLETERQLIKGFSKDVLSKAHHWLILHGRYTCTARNPKCTECGLNALCRYPDKN
jgi:endonuclease-3